MIVRKQIATLIPVSLINSQPKTILRKFPLQVSYHKKAEKFLRARHNAYVPMAESVYLSDSNDIVEAELVLYFSFLILGGHIGLPAMFATIFLAPKQSKRDPTYISVLLSWIVFATSALFLWVDLMQLHIFDSDQRRQGSTRESRRLSLRINQTMPCVYSKLRWFTPGLYCTLSFHSRCLKIHIS